MAKRSFHQPDEEKMAVALRRYQYQPTGVILLLAWREGLTRNEIHDLTWPQVDFASGQLRLPDREIPLEDATAEVLQRWKRRRSQYSEYVAVSDRRRTRLILQSISALVRNALDSVGMRDVTLKDLRYDFIRRQLETHEWPYVLRISGLSVDTYFQSYVSLFSPDNQPPPAAPEKNDAAESEYRIWRVMQEKKETPEGIALWLLRQLGLQLAQIVNLTWDDIDFERNTISVEDSKKTLPQGVRRVLWEEHSRRAPDEDPHVILSPLARKPIDPRRLSVMIRTELIRGGVESITSIDVRRGQTQEVEGKLILDHVTKTGHITTKQAAELLNMTDGRARYRLKLMTEQGKLVCVGTRYYSAETTVSSERHRELILRHISEYGSIRRQDAALILNIPARQAGLLLRHMVEDELIALDGGVRYVRRDVTLPMNNKDF